MSEDKLIVHYWWTSDKDAEAKLLRYATEQCRAAAGAGEFDIVQMNTKAGSGPGSQIVIKTGPVGSADRQYALFSVLGPWTPSADGMQELMRGTGEFERARTCCRCSGPRSNGTVVPKYKELWIVAGKSLGEFYPRMDGVRLQLLTALVSDLRQFYTELKWNTVCTPGYF